jgi:hypothetical protein
MVDKYPQIMVNILQGLTLVDPIHQQVLNELTELKKDVTNEKERKTISSLMKFYKCIILSLSSLFPAIALRHADLLTRYPIKETDFSNVYVFTNPAMNHCCETLAIIVRNHIEMTTEIVTSEDQGSNKQI